MWPRGITGFSTGWITCWPAPRAAPRPPRFSASVLPVTVRQSPCRKPALEQVLHHRRRAADGVQVFLDVLCRSASGRRAAARGRSRSGSRRATAGSPPPCAIAIRCSTALVEPPTRHHHRHRVLERFARQDVERLQVALEQHANARRRPGGIRPPSPDLRPASRSCTAATVPSASIADRHRVGGVHPAARARARAGVADDVDALLVGDDAGEVLAVGLERRDDVARLAERRARRGSCRRRPSATGRLSRAIAISRAGHVLVAARARRRARRTTARP